ncbi:MAG: RNA-binding protein, partial [bacterium]
MEENKKKLFVGGISFNTTEDSLRDFFATAGTVESATVITDKMSGRSKGFGFVEMSTEEEAQAAIDKLNGQELDGRAISVNIARPKTEGDGGNRFGGNRGGGPGG